MLPPVNVDLADDQMSTPQIGQSTNLKQSISSLPPPSYLQNHHKLSTTFLTAWQKLVRLNLQLRQSERASS